ncbi:hypothetical protein UAO_01770 [Enterococcus villorum ATCC 700913]|uniref:Uncharacterized protein n=1 Tax=Enterococcus villorum ATCC 700913 TaxID=1158604 RepID=A0ABN0KFZ1_9ENTE|nr:hypothetical protein UAO_01770 [Enterococcus villorum ATCC 700913]EOW76305.1 hypothetical protein I591_01607 [Enterococcus villorum ATCC 700913]
MSLLTITGTVFIVIIIFLGFLLINQKVQPIY